MARHRFVAVVGARELPESWAERVEAVVQFFVGRGWGIGSGGARGADQYALAAVVAAGRAACARSVVFLPGTPGVGGAGVHPGGRPGDVAAKGLALGHAHRPPDAGATSTARSMMRLSLRSTSLAILWVGV